MKLSPILTESCLKKDRTRSNSQDTRTLEFPSSHTLKLPDIRVPDALLFRRDKNRADYVCYPSESRDNDREDADYGWIDVKKLRDSAANPGNNTI